MERFFLSLFLGWLSASQHLSQGVRQLVGARGPFALAVDPFELLDSIRSFQALGQAADPLSIPVAPPPVETNAFDNTILQLYFDLTGAGPLRLIDISLCHIRCCLALNLNRTQDLESEKKSPPQQEEGIVLSLRGSLISADSADRCCRLLPCSCRCAG